MIAPKPHSSAHEFELVEICLLGTGASAQDHVAPIQLDSCGSLPNMTISYSQQSWDFMASGLSAVPAVQEDVLAALPVPASRDCEAARPPPLKLRQGSFDVPLGSYHAPFLGYPISGSGIYSHKVGYFTVLAHWRGLNVCLFYGPISLKKLQYVIPELHLSVILVT